MKILLTGGHGQLGWEMQRFVPDGNELAVFGSGDLDVTDRQEVQRIVTVEKPDVIVNAAAYTKVDEAEQNVTKSFLVNGQGAANLAQAAWERGARLIHISTDFIFDGQQSRPYLPSDQPRPIGVYGRSKLAGEEQVLAITKGENTAIIRTAWVYSSHGNNFVKTMLRLMRERETLTVVADQVGTPTWACNLARAVWSVVTGGINGIHHFTDAGVASWYDFAVAIMEEAQSLGILSQRPLITPISSSDYPLPAQRPPYSVLDKTSLWRAINWQPDHWRVALRAMLREMV